MMDENDRSHEDYRSLRHISRKEGSEDTAPIEVDSSAFFSELPPEQPATTHPYRPRPIRPWMEPWQYLPSGGKFC